ncbi:hypothetical protein G4B88_015193, partial [Cannabis sativa]
DMQLMFSGAMYLKHRSLTSTGLDPFHGCDVMEVKVTVISTSPDKKEEAIHNLGANSFFISRAMSTMDGIIDTIFVVHPLMPLIGLLRS